MNSSVQKVARLHGDIRQAIRDMERAGAEAEAERSRLLANPDHYRGDQTVEQAQKAIAERARLRIHAARQKAADAFQTVGDEIRYMRRRSTTYNGEAAAAHAWLHRAKPLLDGGATVADLIAFAEQDDDQDLLAGAWRHIGSYMAAKTGTPNDPAVAFALEEAKAAIERGQARLGLDSDLAEYRSALRESRALGQEFDAMVKLELTHASTNLTGPALLEAGYAIASARAAAGEQS